MGCTSPLLHPLWRSMEQPPGLWATQGRHTISASFCKARKVCHLYYFFPAWFPFSSGSHSCFPDTHILISWPLLNHFCQMLGQAPSYISSFHPNDSKAEYSKWTACPQIKHAAGKWGHQDSHSALSDTKDCFYLYRYAAFLVLIFQLSIIGNNPYCSLQWNFPTKEANGNLGTNVQ